MAEIRFELKKYKKCAQIKNALNKCMLKGNIETHYLLVCPENDVCKVKTYCKIGLKKENKRKINDLRKYINDIFECPRPILKIEMPKK